MQKHQQILMNQTYVSKSIDYLPIILDPCGFWVFSANQNLRVLVRVDSWYLWEIHLLNFWYFQETTNPFKILIPTPASDRVVRQSAMGVR